MRSSWPRRSSSGAEGAGGPPADGAPRLHAVPPAAGSSPVALRLSHGNHRAEASGDARKPLYREPAGAKHADRREDQARPVFTRDAPATCDQQSQRNHERQHNIAQRQRILCRQRQRRCPHEHGGRTPDEHGGEQGHHGLRAVRCHPSIDAGSPTHGRCASRNHRRIAVSLHLSSRSRLSKMTFFYAPPPCRFWSVPIFACRRSFESLRRRRKRLSLPPRVCFNPSLYRAL
jgi:hypothetical protein